MGFRSGIVNKSRSSPRMWGGAHRLLFRLSIYSKGVIIKLL